VHPLELAIYAGLGVAGGLVSVVFVKLLLGLRRGFLRLPKRTAWWQPVIGGLIVGSGESVHRGTERATTMLWRRRRGDDKDGHACRILSRARMP